MSEPHSTGESGPETPAGWHSRIPGVPRSLNWVAAVAAVAAVASALLFFLMTPRDLIFGIYEEDDVRVDAEKPKTLRGLPETFDLAETPYARRVKLRIANLGSMAVGSQDRLWSLHIDVTTGNRVEVLSVAAIPRDTVVKRLKSSMPRRVSLELGMLTPPTEIDLDLLVIGSEEFYVRYAAPVSTSLVGLPSLEIGSQLHIEMGSRTMLPIGLVFALLLTWSYATDTVPKIKAQEKKAKRLFCYPAYIVLYAVLWLLGTSLYALLLGGIGVGMMRAKLFYVRLLDFLGFG